ncbi:MAG: tetratricopeptide repeat protein [Polyangiaceae bacterium]|nr:tetratricopeptide repeat protein [Polyangiaceae bacterium]
MHPHMFTHTQPPSEGAAIEALYAMGHSLLTQERFQEAAAVLRIMLQVAPTDERSWLALGECHERINQLDIALELYGAGTVANQDAGRCEIARARILREQDRVAEAVEALELATNIAERLDDDELQVLIEQERRAQS